MYIAKAKQIHSNRPQAGLAKSFRQAVDAIGKAAVAANAAITRQKIQSAHRRIHQIDEALVWEVKQGMSKKRFMEANKQVAAIKKILYGRIARWERRLGR